MAIAIPPSVIVLMVAPKARRTSTAAASDSGIAVKVIVAARRLARKNNTITMTSRPPSRSAVMTLSTATSMKSDCRKILRSMVMPARQLLLQRVELAVEPPGQLDGVGAGLLLHADDHRRLAAPRSFAALERAALAHVGHVANEDRPRPAQRDQAFADLRGRADAADRLQDVLLRTFGEDAGRGVLARAADGVQQLGDRHAVGAQLIRVGDHLELPLGAAERRDLRHAGNRQQPPAHDGVGDGAQRQRIVGVGRNREEQNLAHDRRDRRQHRPVDLRRQRAADQRQLLGDDLARAEDVGAPVEFHPDDGDAQRRRRADAPHARRAVDRRLDRERDQRFHLLGGHPAAFGQNRDGRRGQVGEHVDRHVARHPEPRQRPAATDMPITIQ